MIENQQPTQTIKNTVSVRLQSEFVPESPQIIFSAEKIIA